MILNPSLFCADPLNMARDIDALVAAGVEMFHIDIMDGRYVPNLALNFDQVRAIHRAYSQPLDVHIMVEDPGAFVDRLGEAGAAMLSFQLDAARFPVRLVNQIRNKGMKPGVVLNPVQRVEELVHLLPMLDQVLLMAIEPGFSGQPFLPSVYQKIRRLDEMRRQSGLTFQISVDGGIGIENGRQCMEAGADILVGGLFACFNQPDGIEASARRFIKALNGT